MRRPHLIIGIILLACLTYVIGRDIVNRFGEAEVCYNERIHSPIRGAGQNREAWEECKAIHLYFPLSYFSR